MIINTYPGTRRLIVAALAIGALTSYKTAMAEADWISITMDNDTFVGNDSGYTNGIYGTWIDTPDNNAPKPGFLARAMMWSLPDGTTPGREFSVKTIGQVMSTPEEITQDPPILPPDDLPYGGLLFYSDSFVRVTESYADRVAVTIGVMGEASLAEESQKFVHDLIGSDEPCCWDQQLDDEIVFQIGRSRVWRSWVSDSGNADLVFGAELELGTISSSVGALAAVRYGEQMDNTYATTMLAKSRTANPIATDSGWYVFAGLRAGYVANSIFLDGSKSYDNDFEEIEYSEDGLGYTVGLAYSWKDWSLTFAMNHLNVNEDDDSADEYLEFGTFTLAWRSD